MKQVEQDYIDIEKLESETIKAHPFYHGFIRFSQFLDLGLKIPAALNATNHYKDFTHG